MNPPNVNLQPGQTGADVKKLQDYLVSKGYMTQPQVNTGYGTYGPQTTAAVAKLQKDNGVDNSTGVGYWGPRTMASLTKQTVTEDKKPPVVETPKNAPIVDTTKLTSTGNANLDKIQQSIAGMINTNPAQYQIPENLKITPALTAQFLNWAHQAVDPQTQQLISAEAADVNSSLNNLQKQYELETGQAVQNYGTNLAKQNEEAAGSGIAFSGLRGLQDQNLTNTTNRSLAGLTNTASTNIGNTLRTGAEQVGSQNTGLFNVPTINGVAVNSANNTGINTQGVNTGGANYNYNPSAYTAGSIPTSQNTALGTLQSNYQKQYGDLAANNSNGDRSMSDLLGMISGRPANASTNLQ